MQNKADTKIEKIEGSFDYPSFYKRMVSIAVPIVIQQLILVSLNLADTIMVGKVGEQALAAVGAANQVFFVYIDILFGVYSGAAVFAVQFFGIKDMKKFHKVVGIEYFMCGVVAIPFTLLAFLFPAQLISLFIDEPEVIEMGSEYLRIVSVTYLLQGLSYIVSYNSRVIERLTVPTIANCIAIVTNIFLNYCLIFGNFGFERMEVKGAAIATLTARILECALMYLYVILDKKNPMRTRPGNFRFEWDMFRTVMKRTLPVIINEAAWVFSFTVGFAIYGRLGSASFAVVQVVSTISDVFLAFYCGLGNAINVIIGKNLGNGNTEDAYRVARIGIRLSWVLNVVTTAVLIIIREPICIIYDFAPETTALMMQALLVFAIAMTPRMMGYMFICGILRAGGDTVWTMVMDAGINWAVQVPIILFTVKAGLPLPVCLAAASASDVVKTVMGYARMLSKKWMNVFTGR